MDEPTEPTEGAIRAGRGILAGAGTSVDSFCEAKEEEIDWEDRRLQALPTPSPEEIRRRNQETLALLHQWRQEDSAYDDEVLRELLPALRRNRGRE